MIFGDTVNDDYLVRNPNDFRYQPEPNTLLDNLKFNLQTAIATGAQNIQTILDNVAQNLKMNLENYKQNTNEYNNQYGNEIEPLFKFDLTTKNQNNLVQEDLIKKDTRIQELEDKIRDLQYNHLLVLDKTRNLENEKLEDQKQIQNMKKEIKEIKNNPFMKWWERATEDSKKERII